jgi:hypothetical protein
MSNSMYPFTSAYFGNERVESPGQAFLGGFGAGQQVNQRAQQMDAQQQLMKMRQLEEQRTSAMEPLRMRAAQQAVDFAAQNQPLNFERLQLANQQTRQAMANTAEGRAAAAALQRYILQGGTGAPPTAAPAAPAPRGSGLMPPEGAPAPAPATAPGPQSSAPEWLNQQFGERRFPGLRLASAGVNDYTGLPTGMAPPAVEGGPQDNLAGLEGFYRALPAPAAPAAPPQQLNPNAPLPVFRPRAADSPRLVDAAVAELSVDPSLQTPAMVEQVARQYGIDPSVVAQRLGVSLPTPTPAAAPTPPQTPAQAPAAAPATAAERGEQTEVASQETAGLRPQGAQTQEQIATELNRRIDQLTTEVPKGLDAMEPWRIGVESRTLDVRERNIQVRERQVASMRQEAALIARQNPGAALQMLNAVREAEGKLQEEREAIGLNRANLNGRVNISNFMAGNYAGLANDIYRASNGQLRLQPRADGTFNIWGPEGERAPRATGVSAQDIINRGRELYDDNYKTQVAGIRQRQTERQGQLFDAYIKGFEESLKNASATSREVTVERAKAAANAANRDPNVRATADPTTGVITLFDATGRTPIRSYRPSEITDARGKKIWGMVPVEVAPTQTR